MTETIELTRVHDNFKADTFFPDLNFNDWDKISEKKYYSDNLDNLSFSFITYKKNKS